ncbi:MAG: UDP-N-acetylmuramoyl-L-alanyl-D-glutamate--2,6-diaminopimelate ligase [Synergistaceae bacterium]|jgi:UDP-N-acetylmuramoyl-L-alanyl-D-glutamate--2,6-diaminopimelate ligase|nr:UDP-N-acetylmuramoyl-L-alanyl-D-glutamate--2,6-diaminopimelate ligase [Synergistaceae bacterium]
MMKKWSSVTQALRDGGFEFTAVKAREGREKDPYVSGVFSDHRKLLPGSVFCCVRGEKDDGHRYVSAAEAAGAAALVCESPVDTDLPAILVRSTREVMGETASAVYGNPASKLFMAGVTGTNGKSTTTYILRGILQAAGVRTGLLGTIVENDGVRERDAERTTPESCDIQRLLAGMVKNNCGACVMETSSHGLQIGRLSGCLFDAAVFTNLYPEHLDFHKDMENYFQAKRLLFTKYSKKGRIAAINADDAYGARLLEEFPEARGFKISDAANVCLSVDGSAFTVDTEGFPPLPLRSPLAGMFNISNTLAAVAALRGVALQGAASGIGDDIVARGVAEIPQVPGRLERHMMPNGACCIVDFAHTPEALRNVLSTVRGFCSGRLISVFGHGGGRYQANRAALGEIAASLADMVLVTMDNPRDEDPAAIAESIVEGIKKQKKAGFRVILDRKEAIRTALSVAGPGDVLVISGKGPEKFLLIGKQKIPSRDADIVEEWKRLASG